MTWWQWIVVGSLLLGAELMVDAQFYLVFLGASALMVGLIGLSPWDAPFWAEVLMFSALSVASLVLFRKQIYAKVRSGQRDTDEGVTGEVAIATEKIEAGQVGKVELRGTLWNAKNTGDEALAAGARAKVESVSGLTVMVRAE